MGKPTPNPQCIVWRARDGDEGAAGHVGNLIGHGDAHHPRQLDGRQVFSVGADVVDPGKVLLVGIGMAYGVQLGIGSLRHGQGVPLIDRPPRG